jgi:hypothetical protein
MCGIDFFVNFLIEGCLEGCMVLCVMCVILYDVCYCNVLYCTVLYCTVLYCPVLHCSTLPPGMSPFAVNNNNNAQYMLTIICFFQHSYMFRCLYIILSESLVIYAKKMKTSIEGVVTKKMDSNH